MQVKMGVAIYSIYLSSMYTKQRIGERITHTREREREGGAHLLGYFEVNNFKMKIISFPIIFSRLF